MTSVVFYFEVHQPFRLRPYKREEIGKKHDYWDDGLNELVLRRVAERCYLPMNKIILDLIEKTDGQFRCAFSLTGTVIQQMQTWAPEALESFVALAKTGCVEFMGETTYHSLAFEQHPEEFKRQIEEHSQRIEKIFGKKPVTFRNTELVISNQIAKVVQDLGFKVMLGEGADRLLHWRTAKYPFRVKDCNKLGLFLRNYRFSDDIGFRFSNREWPHYPLLASTFAKWLHEEPGQDNFIGLFIDYETFGEHQWEETGILDFMKHLPEYVLENPNFRFQTPAEAAEHFPPMDILDIPDPVSWADEERDLSAWLGNHMQRAAHASLYRIAEDAQRAADAGHPEMLRDWRRLTTSDHVYYMCTKHFSDRYVHDYFSPYDMPYDAFMTFMAILDDLKQRIRAVI